MSDLLLYCDGRRLTVTPPDGAAFSLACTDDTLTTWRAFAARYTARNSASRWGGSDGAAHLADLRTLGHDLYQWLDDLRAGWLTNLLPELQEPTLTISVPPKPRGEAAEVAHLFFDLPWELLADSPDRTLAEDAQDPLVVLRRVGQADTPAEPEPYRLSMVFMAAAPEDQQPLDFEAEETAILAAADTVSMELFVEESGTLSGLTSLCRDLGFVPTALHLSCHGRPGALCFEDDAGPSTKEVTAADLQQALPAMPPLVFLNARSSGDATDDGAAFGRLLVGLAGVQVVVSWRGAVADHAARLFAQTFYGALCAKVTVDQALRQAQRALLRDPDCVHERHRARILLAPAGGGALVTGNDARLPHLLTAHEYLDTVNRRIPVAGRHAFVGRRRELRRLLEMVRRQKTPGALIQGIGHIGKSSLTNRVAHRLFEHRKVVLYGAWAVDELTKALREHYADAPKPPPSMDADGLSRYLREVLRIHAHGHTQQAPPLLVIMDDFEQALLTPRPDQACGIDPAMVPAVAAVLQAFAEDQGRSFLIITSRFRFTLPWQGRDLADVLPTVALRPMSPVDRAKQLRAIAAHPDASHKKDATSAEAGDVLAQGGGIPGLQDRLWNLWQEVSPEQFATVLADFKTFWQGGQVPDDSQVQVFLKAIWLPRVLSWLSPEELAILAAFKPVPVWLPRSLVAAVLTEASMDTADGTRITRLQGLSLLDAVTDPNRGERLTLAPLVAPRIAHLPRKLRKHLATALSTHAPTHMPANQYAWSEAYFFTRITLWCDLPLPADPAPENALSFCINPGEYRKAGRLARLIFTYLGGDPHNAALPLLRRMATAFRHSGRSGECSVCFQLGASMVEARTATLAPDPEVGYFYYEHSDYLLLTGNWPLAKIAAQRGRDVFQLLGTHFDNRVAQGWGLVADVAMAQNEYDEVLRIRHEEELPVYERTGDIRSQAIVWGQIADVHMRRGEFEKVLYIRVAEQFPVYMQQRDMYALAVTWSKIVDVCIQRCEYDEALQICQAELLPAFQKFGDIRQKALTWGQIADVHMRRGDLDEALRIRTDEQLPIFERLGNDRDIAIIWGHIANVRLLRGEVEEALRIHTVEGLPVYERLGDVREKALTWGQIADIYKRRGEIDEALRIRKVEQLPVFKRLGDVRETAVTWGQIADIYVLRGDDDKALRIRTKEELPVYERLGDLRSKAVAWGKIADVHMRRNEVDEAFKIRMTEEMPIYEQLGDVLAKAVTWGCIADVHLYHGNIDEALRIHMVEQLPVFDRSGDVHSMAATWGKIADVHMHRGEVDEALRIRTTEELPVFERLGAAREKAICKAKIAIALAKTDIIANQNEISRLFVAATKDIQHMGIPESNQIKNLFERFQIDLSEREGTSLDVVRARLSGQEVEGSEET